MIFGVSLSLYDMYSSVVVDRLIHVIIHAIDIRAVSGIVLCHLEKHGQLQMQKCTHSPNASSSITEA